MAAMPLPLPRETRIALEVMQALGASEIDGLALETAADLATLLGDWEYTGLRTRDDAEARALGSLRAEIVAIWDAERDEAATLANAILERWGTPPMLVRHDGYDWHVHAVADDRPLAERIAVESAMAFVDLIRIDETARCKRCADETCMRPFLDESPGRTRRFCSTQCQSRVNVAAYRARQR